MVVEHLWRNYLQTAQDKAQSKALPQRWPGAIAVATDNSNINSSNNNDDSNNKSSHNILAKSLACHGDDTGKLQA